jgi:hypothetical protein
MKQHFYFALIFFLSFGCKKNDVVQPNNLITPNVQLQVITKYLGDPNFKLDLISQSNAPFNITSSNLSVATILKDSIKVIGIGESNLIVIQEPNEQYNKVNLSTVLFVKSRIKPTLSDFNNIYTQLTNFKTKINPPKSNSGGKFFYSIIDPSIAKIEGDSLIILKEGETSIKAKQSIFGEFSENEISATIAVSNSTLFLESKKYLFKEFQFGNFITDIEFDRNDNLIVVYQLANSGVSTKTYSISKISNSGKEDIIFKGTFKGISSIAIDENNIIYICDLEGKRIYKLTPSGLLSVFAGSGISEINDGLATEASFIEPRSIVFDKDRNLIVADGTTIRKIDPNGKTVTISGNSKISGFKDGTGEEATLKNPNSLAIDKNNILYFSDQNGLVVRKLSGNKVETYLGDNIKGDFDGKGVKVRFTQISDLYFDKYGSLFVGDRSENSGICKIRIGNNIGVITTLQNVYGEISSKFTSNSKNQIYFSETYGKIFSLK